MKDWTNWILALLVVIIVAMFAYVIVMVADQHTGKNVIYQNVVIVDKQSYTSLMLLPVGKTFMPIYTPHFELSFQMEGQTLSGDVSESCYNKMSVGDKMDISIVYGKYSTGVYPVCN